MKPLSYSILVFLILSSCFRPSQNIEVIQSSDYNHLLQQIDLQEPNVVMASDITFWEEKVANSQTNVTYLSKLANLYHSYFKATGRIEYLHLSDSLLNTVEEKHVFSKAATYQALSRNAISQHAFKDAKMYAELALAEGEKKSISYLFLFDALMELGEYGRANGILNMIQNKNSFDYLIRASKMADHEGDLDQAIQRMEQAHERVKSNPKFYVWSLSNLADMYGHNGEIEKSYQAYLEVLDKDATHWHSWKGIAWIAYANDLNLQEAKRILNQIQTHHNDPELLLMHAEIAAFEKNKSESQQKKEEFYDIVSAPQYQTMYNKYLILLEADDFDAPNKAFERAEQEQMERSTPEIYSLMAYTLLQQGKNMEALTLSQQHVENKTFEPEAIYHLGLIYHANGQTQKANTFLKEAHEASFELGPVVTQHIENLLAAK